MYILHTYPLHPALSRSKGEQYTSPHAIGAALQHLYKNIYIIYAYMYSI